MKGFASVAAMNTSPDPGSLSRSPIQYADYLRGRAEEAIAASVHHASLSQQYLTLSQKFSALAEQAASGQTSGVENSLRQLETEAYTGQPAAPIGIQQSAMGTVSRPNVARPHFLADVADPSARRQQSVRTSVNATQTPLGDTTTNEARSFYSPPARIADPLPDAPVPKATEPESSIEPPGGMAKPALPTAKRPKRRKLSLRTFLERARIAALERSERVRIRAKKSDLKPVIRKTSDEIRQELKRSRVPASISTVVTLLALLLLAFRQLEFVEPADLPPLVASFSETLTPVEESLPIEPPAEEIGEQLETPEPTPEPMPEPEPEVIPEPVTPVEPEPMPVEPEPMPVEAAEPVVPEVQNPLPESPAGTIPTNPDSASSHASLSDSRSEASRQMLLEKFGGSAASESAVGLALEWLAARQRSNGSWDFIDVGTCTNPGTVNNPIGGTAYALLPFLAAGQTHRDGPYRKRVQAGLDFLMSVGIRAPAGYDLRGVVNKLDKDEDPNYAYYVHGAATLALCEAYAMTKDRKLKAAAEEAVVFLVNSQDPRGGGWRYNPQQPGSTSATAIQLMALKAAEKAGIRIPDATWKGVSYYLDSVAVDQEGRYGYEVQKKAYDISVTSMALLSRMYLGWGRDDGDLRAGIALIDKRGPYDNLYYNYFATQVMKNWGGIEWDRWNGRLRDDLIAWQEKDGDAKGSWAPRDRADYSKAGGRLLTTALSTLTLEVYYRYQPVLPASDISLSPQSAD
jgi:hypothetical protein